jgi:hypothetical protein
MRMKRSILLFFALSGCQFIPGTDAAKIREAEKAVAGKLNDPASAQFRNEMVEGYEGGTLVCGEVNGKNQFGAYNGFAPFAYDRRSGAVNISQADLLAPAASRLAGFAQSCHKTRAEADAAAARDAAIANEMEQPAGNLDAEADKPGHRP